MPTENLDEEPVRATSRTPIGRAALGATGVLLVAAAFAGAREPCLGRLPAWSAQLHLHGSFSEGVGSIDSHSWEASDVGVDVLWWSDHDFRISSYRAPSTFGFDTKREPLGQGEAWEAGPLEELRDQKSEGGGKWIRETDKRTSGLRGHWKLIEEAVQGKRALMVSATHEGSDLRAYLLTLSADNLGFRRPLAANIRLELAVKPGASGPDAHALLRLLLSEHAPRGDVGLERYALEFALVADPGEPRLVGSTWRVELAIQPGEWNRVTIPVSRHAAEGFPFLVGEDNSLGGIHVGVESRAGAAALVLVDDLRIVNGEPGAGMLERQLEVIEAVSEGYPGIEQMQGIEVSYMSLHLNEFSTAPRLFDYDRFVAELSGAGPLSDERRRELAGLVGRRVVEQIHGRGGLVSYNHMFGASWGATGPRQARGEVLRELLGNGVLDTDLLEVGYVARGGHDLADHLWVWDRLAQAGHPLVGTGVSDSHGGEEGRWRTADNNFVSWIFAPEPTRELLLEGLRAGRVFFGDITRFDGVLDIESERGFTMGQVVWTDRESVALKLFVEGGETRSRLRIVRSGKAGEGDGAPIDANAPVEIELDVAARPVTTLRFEVRGGSRGPVALSNHLTFARGPLARTVAGVRVGLDLGGVFARRLEGLDLEEARAIDGGVVLKGEGRGGPVRIDCAGLGGRPEVELEGLGGSWRAEGTVVVLTELSGRGEVLIRRAAGGESR